jgi:hydroxymethylbilane synthase
MLASIKIATRQSPLAIWQANYVKELLLKHDPTLHIELVGITTEGDKNLADSLAKVGGKGLFVKELELALQQGHADLAVHSMKDMTVHLPEGLMLAAYCPREDVRDAFLNRQGTSLNELPKGAVVGTSSLRRQAQLLALRPDIIVKPLRGNVNTRLSKLNQGEFDAIILAAAGLIRLGLQHKISSYLDLDVMLPAVGQAIIGIECRTNDLPLRKLLEQIDCSLSRTCIIAERAMNYYLGGHCLAPIAALATVNQSQLHLRGRVVEPNGKVILESNKIGKTEEPELLGQQVAEELLALGAADILNKLKT